MDGSNYSIEMHSDGNFVSFSEAITVFEDTIYWTSSRRQLFMFSDEEATEVFNVPRTILRYVQVVHPKRQPDCK